jgi:hypothetical protein
MQRAAGGLCTATVTSVLVLGRFCRLGFFDARRPVTVLSCRKLDRSRPSSEAAAFSMNGSTYVDSSLLIARCCRIRPGIGCWSCISFKIGSDVLVLVACCVAWPGCVFFLRLSSSYSTVDTCCADVSEKAWPTKAFEEISCKRRHDRCGPAPALPEDLDGRRRS